jgi:hypothetical protein
MKTSIYSLISLLGVLTVEIDADHRSLLRGSTSTSSTNTDSVAFRRGLQDSTNPFQFLTGTVPTTTVAATTTDPFAYQSFGSTDNLQNCPVSSTSAFCFSVGKAPVLCAGRCEYDNYCLAAGTDLSDCISRVAMDPKDEKELFDSSEPESGTCPVTGPAVSCLNEADPVVCGIDDCEYNNLCLALGTGFIEEDCFSSQCPKPDAESCTKELVPVSCDDCIYDNICTAGAAGFLENDCELVDQEVAVACVTALLSCEDDIGPVICDDSCEYYFLCIAIASGYSEDQCVPVEGKLIPVDSSGTSKCPKRDPALVCSTIVAPVVCDACEYENGCVASGAGYAADDCEPLEESTGPIAIPINPDEINPRGGCPVPGTGPIDLKVSPVLCNGDCEYTNFSVARAAGYSLSECRPLSNIIGDAVPAPNLESIPSKPSCPIGNRGIAPCPESFDPVLCTGTCEYDNLCSAQAGPGFTEEDCEPIEIDLIEPREPCPETAPVPCNKMYDPVVCKDVCSYGNMCLGVGAGFLESDCLPDDR